MRSLFAFVLAVSCLSMLPQHGYGAAAALCAAPSASPYERPLIDAKIVCGQFEEGFTCKYAPGGRPSIHKNPSGIIQKETGGQVPDVSSPSPAPAPDGSWNTNTSQPPRGTAQTCPPNTELLGGNCVPYTARCKNGMALDALPQACAMEEKQVCRPRGDGLKDCCCITYSKF